MGAICIITISSFYLCKSPSFILIPNQVTKYGYITFKRKYCTFLATPLPVLLRNRVLPIIAPFHADNDPQQTNGRVYYRVYDARQRFLSLATWRVMSRVDAEVQKARPTSGFSSTWLMTVTWYKMPPYPYYRTGGREASLKLIFYRGGGVCLPL